MRSLVVLVLLSVMLAGCLGYVPGRKSYWDAQVRELCEKDGGVTVYDTVELSEEEYKALHGTHGALPVPFKRNDKSNYPYAQSYLVSFIRDANPIVKRSEQVIERRSDGKILGRSVRYTRTGGDFPTGLYFPSSFSCPDFISLSKQIFKVKQGAK